MIKLREVAVRGDTPHGLLISWSIAETSEDLSLYSFRVFRSGGAAGPFSPVSPELHNTLRFFDQQADQASRQRGYYYRIQVSLHGPHPQVAEYPEDDSAYLKAAPDVVAQELAFRFGAQLYVHAGRRVFIFPAKREGQRCACYDSVRGRPRRSDCPSCYGNTYAGGFWNPILVPAKLYEGGSSTGPHPSGSSGMIQLPVYPLLNKGDLIVEAEGTRWRVPDKSAVKVMRHGRSPYQQHASLVEVPSQDVVYTIPVDFTGVEVAPEARYLRRMH